MRKTFKAKIAIILVVIAFLFFFSNDFGLIDVEKTSIITAIAIDKENDDYLVTAQIAVPEATDTNSENLKAQLTGKGSTVGAALKDLGDVSGWFPKLAFCNLILVGNSLTNTNVIEALDYFAKTLRVQDSALVALTEKDAKEVLSSSTPLDNISAFALQKIMFKTQGFDNDVASTDIKTFCVGHYSKNNSSYMPLVKMVSSGEDGANSGQGGTKSQGGSSGNESGEKTKDKKVLYDARSTALFKDGHFVGELDSDLTLTLNALTENFKGTTLPVDGVLDSSEKKSNYLLSVTGSKHKIKFVKGDVPTLSIKLSLYCKISDHAVEGSTEALSENKPLPKELTDKTHDIMRDRIDRLVKKSIETKCDFLGLNEKLYRFNHKQYSQYKDDLLSKMKVQITVNIEGQK
ncbi:MAG: hypothetical protein E7340_00025 [Clostridiales bacterium]|nr:hypothetical protein [Clostridiales bacterium]